MTTLIDLTTPSVQSPQVKLTLMQLLDTLTLLQKIEALRAILQPANRIGQAYRIEIAKRMEKQLNSIDPYTLYEAWQLLLILQDKEQQRRIALTH